MKQAKINEYVTIFEKKASSLKNSAAASPRDQLIRLYSGAKNVNNLAAGSSDKLLKNKAGGLFNIASRLLWNAENHGVTASFFADMLGRLSSLSTDINNYIGKQLKNPFGADPTYAKINDSLKNFDVAVSRTLPVNLGAFKGAPVEPSKKPSPKSITQPPKHLEEVTERMRAEETGLPPGGEIGGPAYPRTIPGPVPNTRVTEVDVSARPESGAAYEKPEKFDWSTEKSPVKNVEPPKANVEFPKSKEEEVMESWYTE